TDLAWARAARAAAGRFPSDEGCAPRSIIYSSTTAALLWRRPGAIRFDAPASGNRLGFGGGLRRPVGRGRVRASPLLLPLSEGGLHEVSPAAVAGAKALVLGLPVESSGPVARERDIAAITYAANPLKKGLDRVLEAWRIVRAQPVRAQRDDGEQLELVVA